VSGKREQRRHRTALVAGKTGGVRDGEDGRKGAIGQINRPRKLSGLECCAVGEARVRADAKTRKRALRVDHERKRQTSRSADCRVVKRPNSRVWKTGKLRRGARADSRAGPVVC
jgi:hypothetical protein